MTCEKREQQILLAEAGELRGSSLAELHTHLAVCEQCRAYRETVRLIEAAGRDALPVGSPGPAAMARVRAAAEAGRGPVRLVLFRYPVLQSLAYAAVLCLLLGAWFLLPREARLMRIERVSTIAALVQEDYSEAEAGNQPDTEVAKLRALASELLEIQGFAADELYGGEALTLPGEPDPTASRGRSTHERCATTRV
jgi:hypothetical protein